jgi:ABC-type glutathione transport system ATPase component
MTLVEVRDLVKHYAGARGWFGLGRPRPPVRAVDGISFTIAAGKTLGLVGESGSGKTTVGRTMLRLQEPTRGTVVFDGNDVFALDAGPLRALRRQMQIVFQDPYSSLNPRMTVAETLREPLEIHGLTGEVSALLDEVGLDAEFAKRYPHELSGGQRQRVGIARALSVAPQFIVCDEPVSALDVSVQAQVLKLIDDVRKRFNLAVLFITHDLRVAAQVCDRIAVMHRGEVVEEGTTAAVFAAPKHDYTRALFDSAPGKNFEFGKFEN